MSLMLGMTVGGYVLPVVADHYQRHVALGLVYFVLMTLFMGLLLVVPKGYYWVTLSHVALSSFWGGGYGPIIDSAVFQICGKYWDRTSFGHIRLWG